VLARRIASGVGWSLLGLAAIGWVVSMTSGYDVIGDVDISRASAPPSAAHWLGCDHLGRDVLWRLVTASQAFVGPGLMACAVALGLGVGGGAVAGWTGGPLAAVIRYVFTVVASLPRFVLVLLTCSIYGNEVSVIAAAAGVAYAPVVGEAIYTRVSGFRVAEFVLAAEAHGVHPARILGYHLLWVNCRRLVARHALNLFAFFLLLETTLSYIGGFGVEEPDPSWGNMIAFEWAIRDGNAWATIAPAVALWALILSAALAGEALAERGDG
jgi:peptide/nickel transport system permease protein